ncbi:MAG: 16S rRNA (adenine(1518)-N(6)/adenine(1519)-N(6))-dimethyltransferase RsmA [Syntrophales bacterium LBB04]|nr:16S rRNA (adenine(1518)-N(6)/adenine(1519)-N(6))-dimethyltransferase RsmA [Syntrophales bacterium LBB04]
MTTVRKILKDHGIRPLKRLGQAFLEDRNAINKIIRISNIQEDDIIVEIGAGVGLMTESIAKQAKKVIALDIDPRMVGILRERMAPYPHVDIVQADVLEYDFSGAIGELPLRKIKVIGNIPYNISSQILFRLLAYRDHISSMILMFQKELADRLIATPGTRAYGVPTVLVSMYLLCSREMAIPASCFYPMPAVMSSVLKMVIREKPQLDLADHDFFFKIAKTAFAKRRKTLLNNLRGLSLLGYSDIDVTKALKNSGIDGARRGETLTALEIGRLSNALHSIKIP